MTPPSDKHAADTSGNKALAHADPHTVAERCDRMLGGDAGHYVRCVKGLGHPATHVGYGPHGDIQAVVWVQGDPREQIVPVPPAGTPPPAQLTALVKLAFLAVALTPSLPTPPAA